jgi:DNA-directed RNA polymerase subunit RPC12/RpoP
MTETALTPDTYAPSVGDDGKYFDCSLSVRFNKNSPGIECGCGSRTVFKNKQAVTQHWKRPIHKRWLKALDNESKNHFIELQKAKELITNQQFLIAQRDKRIMELERTISTITIRQNTTENVLVGNLLGFD